MLRIVLDAVGGDHGPDALIGGAVEAVATGKVEVVLVGPRDVLAARLAAVSGGRDLGGRLVIEHAPQCVAMNESPVEAIRKKPDSSIMVAFDLVRKGQGDAVVSAGNSGATVAAAIKKLGRLDNVLRPGIASMFPTLRQPAVMMDVGANVDCRPQHLAQFAVMAASFSQGVLGIESPRVGLLSIGEETGKGNTLVKSTHDLLSRSRLNYLGNVEGRDVFQGNVDVIVCDGFVGNICLKISEGLADAAMHMLRNEITKTLRTKIGYLLARPAFRTFKKRVDYAEYGGAPLLGINGTGIISHGKSNSVAIKNALLVAGEMVSSRVNERISAALAQDALNETMTETAA
jgi:glycerol-3-phosphate acyltransferase PlsX